MARFDIDAFENSELEAQFQMAITLEEKIVAYDSFEADSTPRKGKNPNSIHKDDDNYLHYMKQVLEIGPSEMVDEYELKDGVIVYRTFTFE